MWEWILDHLTNPDLVRQFEWDAQRVQRYDGDVFSPVYTEPWTGCRWWEVQVRPFQSVSIEAHLKLILFVVLFARRCENGVP
jgi:hypothetical protein